MPWKRTREPFPTLADTDTGVQAAVDHTPHLHLKSELVLTSGAVPNMSLRVPIGDLLWLLRESGVDWRAGIERLPLTDPAVARERERVRAAEDERVYAALDGASVDDAETRGQRR